MVDVDIDLDLSAVDEADRVLLASMERGVRLGAEEGAQEARDVHRWRNRTGETERGIHGRASGLNGEIVSPAAHSTFLESGTRPHAIEARRAPMLHWVDEGGDHRFARRVWHPGTAPSPFMGPAALKFERVVEREVEQGIIAADRALNR